MWKARNGIFTSVAAKTSSGEFDNMNTVIAVGYDDKYHKIRDLEAAKIEWLHEVIDVVEETSYFPDAERWHVIRLTRDGHELTNMRHGSVEHRKELTEQVIDSQIRNAA
jgi:hypothetical protein